MDNETTEDASNNVFRPFDNNVECICLDGPISSRLFPVANAEEMQYLDLCRQILDKGFMEEGRNGCTKSVFGHMMRFNLTNNTIPILTTKKTAWKTCLKELMWFIRGQTNNKILKEQGVHIWDANGSREFLDSRGLTNYEVDELGPIYGYQWRHFNKPYYCNKDKQDIQQKINICWNDGTLEMNTELEDDYNKLSETGVDQLQQIIDALKDPKQRTSRRLIMTAWNPCQLDNMALPPCHILCQFNVHDGNKLSCSMYQRSCDMFLGVPFNIASYSFLTHLLAHHCGLEAYEFVYFMGNCHIYDAHMEAVQQQLNRTPYKFPTVQITSRHDNINDYQVEEFAVKDYVSHDTIRAPLIA